MTKEEIFTSISATLQQDFEIPAEKITMEANLYADLELDSLDAVDLLVTLQDMTGKKVKAEDFKTIRTVADVVDAVDALLRA